jgi:hypothetical protein
MRSMHLRFAAIVLSLWTIFKCDKSSFSFSDLSRFPIPSFVADSISVGLAQLRSSSTDLGVAQFSAWCTEYIQVEPLGGTVGGTCKNTGIGGK